MGSTPECDQYKFTEKLVELDSLSSENEDKVDQTILKIIEEECRSSVYHD